MSKADVTILLVRILCVCFVCVFELQEHMGLVEQQMKGLQAALEAGAASSAALEATNATLIAERTAAGTGEGVYCRPRCRLWPSTALHTAQHRVMVHMAYWQLGT